MAEQKDMTQNYLALAGNVYDPAKTAANALALKKAGQDIQIAGDDAAIRKARLDLENDSQNFTKKLQAMSTAMKTNNPESAKRIYNNLIPDNEDNLDFSFVGSNVKITTPQGLTFTGPQSKVGELLDQVGKDISWVTDPAKANHTFAWAAANGISISQETVSPDISAQIEARAVEGEKDRTSREKIAQMSAESKNKDVVPAKVKQAQDLIKSLRGKTGGSTSQILAGLLKDFDADKAKSIESDIPADLLGTYKAAVSILEEYYGVEKTPTESKSNVTHVFVPGKGLVKKEK